MLVTATIHTTNLHDDGYISVHIHVYFAPCRCIFYWYQHLFCISMCKIAAVCLLQKAATTLWSIFRLVCAHICTCSPISIDNNIFSASHICKIAAVHLLKNSSNLFVHTCALSAISMSVDTNNSCEFLCDDMTIAVTVMAVHHHITTTLRLHNISMLVAIHTF